MIIIKNIFPDIFIFRIESTMPNSNNKNAILLNQAKTTHNTNQLTNSVIQYIQSTNNHLDSLIANKNNISISKEHIKTFKHLGVSYCIKII